MFNSTTDLLNYIRCFDWQNLTTWWLIRNSTTKEITERSIYLMLSSYNKDVLYASRIF